jgi:hypothetical protein
MESWFGFSNTVVHVHTSQYVIEWVEATPVFRLIGPLTRPSKCCEHLETDLFGYEIKDTRRS